VDQAFAQVVEMEEERAERLGLTPGQRNAAANALRGRLVDTRVNAIMILDPDQARDFIRSNPGFLPAPMRAEWLRRIDNARLTRKQGQAVAQSAARVQVNQAFDDAKWQALNGTPASLPATKTPRRDANVRGTIVANSLGVFVTWWFIDRMPGDSMN
jgi:hypothetical protein